jgi:cell division transport system ATP-binding protein
VAGHWASSATTTIPAYRQQIGMVFQDNRLLNDRSAYENVALPLIISGIGEREIGRRTRAALDQVGLLDREKYPPRALSAGEQQRLSIARAIVSRPKVLIADEPTGNLDPDLSLEIMTLFRRLERGRRDDAHRQPRPATGGEVRQPAHRAERRPGEQQ